jgi:hypothetical protein
MTSSTLRLFVVLAAVVGLLAACSTDGGRIRRPGVDGGPVDGSRPPIPDGGFVCAAGQPGCYGTTHYICGADGRSRTAETVCGSACDPALGCVFCRAGTRSCEGTVSRACSQDGAAWVFGRDCAEWSTGCGGDGFCDDACGRAEAAKSNTGCEYWPTPLANTAELNSSLFDYRVVVVNPGTDPSTVRITRGGTLVEERTIASGDLVEISLPWIDGQSFNVPSNDWTSFGVANGAYRLVSTTPVAVTQFNPFEYESGGTYSYTNDATLLLPQHVLTGDYVGASYVPLSTTSGGAMSAPSSIKYPGYLAIVGMTPTPTTVQIVLSGGVAADSGGRWAATMRGGTISFSISRGEVVHVVAAIPPNCDASRPNHNRVEDCSSPFGCDYFDTCEEVGFDLTGSRIHADQPVTVFGGHVCAYVPYFAQACDHLETQLAPIQTWGRAFASTPMVDPGTSNANLVRVIGAFDGTTFTVTPPQSGVSSGALLAGDWTQFIATGPFEIVSDQAVQVAQFLLGQNYSSPAAARGDPGMTVLVPREQYRTDYTFITPSSYNASTSGQSYVLISRLPGVEVVLDGAAVSTTWSTAGGRELGIVPINGGIHTMRGVEPFGIIVYGLGQYTSYAYPGGLNLDQITVIFG